MADGVVFTDEAAGRIGRAVRRVEMMAPNAGETINDGRGFASVPGTVMIEVKVTGLTDMGKGTATCKSLTLYDGKTQSWNGCTYDDADDVAVFELNGLTLTTDALYLAKVIDSNFAPSDLLSARTLCEVDTGAA